MTSIIRLLPILPLDNYSEIDPAVYDAASTHFKLEAPKSYHLVDGAAFVSTQANLRRHDPSQAENIPKLDYVIHDCFTGGFVPPELFTMEFWADLGMMVKSDGVVAIVSFFPLAAVLSSQVSYSQTWFPFRNKSISLELCRCSQ